MFYNIIKSIVGVILKIFFRIRVRGARNIPKDGKLILCSNHASNWDPILISIAFPRQIHWMAKKELFKSKFLSNLIFKLGSFPVDRSGADINAIKSALRILKSEGVLGVFPEGTRVKGFDLNNAKSGAILLSTKSKAPILPVYINGNYRPFSSLDIYIGKPTDYAKNIEGKPSSEDYTNMGKELLYDIYNLQNMGGY